MTTYYIDPVLGNDSNDCLSFAAAGKTLAALNLNSANGGDEIRIVETPSVAITGTNGKFTAQLPSPTSLPAISAASNTSPIQITTGVPHNLVTDDYVYITSVSGNLGANGFWKITRVNDVSFTLNNSVGTGAWTSGGGVRKRTGSVVEFATPQVKNISLNGNQYQTAYPYCAGNWTASAGCSAAANIASSYAVGNAQQIGITSSFTTGKIAYQNLGTTLDLSAWTHVNVLFTFASSSVSVPADGVYYLALCSDTTGSEIVDTLPLNNVVVSSTFGINMKLNIAKQGGGNLGSNIQSVALYRSSAASGTANILIENITAGLAPTTSNVNPRSLISDANAFAGWYQLAGITQDFAVLNSAGNNITTSNPTYYPTGGSSFRALNKLEGFNVGNLSSGQNYQNLNLNTPLTGYINFSGGWTRASNMTENNGGISVWSCGTLTGIGLSANTKSNLTFDSLGFANFNSGFLCQTGANNFYISNCHFISNILGASLSFTNNVNLGIKYDNSLGTCYGTANASHITLSGLAGSARNCILYCSAANASMSVSGSSNYISNIYTANGGGFAISHNSPNSNYEAITVYMHYGTSAIQTFASSGFCKFNNLLMYSNAAYNATAITLTNCNSNIFTNCSINDFVTGVVISGSSYNTIINTPINNATTPISITNAANNNFIRCSGFDLPWTTSSGWSSYIELTNCRDLSNNLLEGTFCSTNVYVKKSNAVSHSGTYSWAVNVGAQGGLIGWKNENSPVRASLSKIKCVAGRTYTVSCWVLRTEAVNQNAYLLLMGGQINGVVNDVVSPNASAGDNVWEQLTLPNFTPTQDGVVEILGANYGSSTSLIHWDDISIVEA